ncbi:MAG: sortase [Peptococcaceae bacterium]|jgi:sortase A|nr:sortase [Peptococcaceae bacterium]
MATDKKRVPLGTILIIAGLAAILAASAIWLYNDMEERRVAEYSRQQAEVLLNAIAGGVPVDGKTGDRGLVADARAGDEPFSDILDDLSYVLLDEEAYMGVLRIPKLNLILPVNVTWSYPALKKTPCRYAGTIEKGDIVIAAHNYNTHFGNINTLAEGDPVIFTDVEGGVYHYYAAYIETVQPSDTYSVVNSAYDLTFFTCTYGGQARVVVRCLRE